MIKPSLVEKLGNLPMHPAAFDKALTGREKYLVVYKENFCLSCGCITPQKLTTHHPECCNWHSDDERTAQDSMFKKNCPQCDGDDLILDSSRELQLSTISCCDCDYVLQKPIPEEQLLKLFNRSVKK